MVHDESVVVVRARGHKTHREDAWPGASYHAAALGQHGAGAGKVTTLQISHKSDLVNAAVSVNPRYTSFVPFEKFEFVYFF